MSYLLITLCCSVRRFSMNLALADWLNSCRRAKILVKLWKSYTLEYLEMLKVVQLSANTPNYC